MAVEGFRYQTVLHWYKMFQKVGRRQFRNMVYALWDCPEITTTTSILLMH